MPTTGPAPEWDWYDNTDLKLGIAQTHGGPYEDTVDEEREYVKEKERRRLPAGQIGFQIPLAAEQPQKRNRRATGARVKGR